MYSRTSQEDEKWKHRTFMLLKFFLCISRFWNRAAANGETSRPICDMHSVSLNKINIWGSKFTSSSPVPGAFTSKEASRPMWTPSICRKKTTSLLSKYSVCTQSVYLSHFWESGSSSVLERTELHELQTKGSLTLQSSHSENRPQVQDDNSPQWSQ